MYRFLGSMSTEPKSHWRGGEKFIAWDPENGDAYECELEGFGSGGKNDDDSDNGEDEDK